MATRYILELCDILGEHKPITRMESLTPFMTASVGDRFDDVGWERLDGIGIIYSTKNPKRYTVHSVKHLILPSQSGITVKYCLNLEPYYGPSSPVWGDE
jgi:hypothetical protein